jgi:hypothetical protein
MKNQNFKIFEVFKGGYLRISRIQSDIMQIFATAFVKGSYLQLKLALRLIKMSIYVIRGKMVPGDVKICWSFIQHIRGIAKTQGLPGTVKYLKVSSVLLQQCVAQYKIDDITPIGPRISRSKSGLPRFIHPLQREKIRLGDPLTIRLWLTLLSIFRDISIPGLVKISSITSESKGFPQSSKILEFIPHFNKLFWDDLSHRNNYINQSRLFLMGLWPIKAISLKVRSGNFSRYIPNWLQTVSYILKDMKEWIPTPNRGVFQILKSGPQAIRSEGIYNSHPLTIMRSFLAYHAVENAELLDSLRVIMNSTAGRFSRVPYLWNILENNSFLFENIKPLTIALGKIGLKLEAAGKVRIFAMVDPWTQWALSPLHKDIFRQLRHLSTDGTFNQMRPLKRVPFNKTSIYSFDLTAATDRLPLFLQEGLLADHITPYFAHHWAKLLTHREYSLPKQNNYSGLKYPKIWPNSVKYTVGQPMGALSSWAMLAMTHHYIVQYCAWSSGVTPKDKLFLEYALLGDDIIIWNTPVAKKYLTVMKVLGLEVNLSKSIISSKGVGLEFAKRTLINGIDVSPIPFKEQDAARRSLPEMVSFAVKYKLTFLQVIRFLGYGYKIDPTKNNRIVKVIKLALSIPKTSLDYLNIFIPKILFESAMTEKHLGVLPFDAICSFLITFIDFMIKEYKLLLNELKYSNFLEKEMVNMRMNPKSDPLIFIKEEVLRTSLSKTISQLKILHEVTSKRLEWLIMWREYLIVLPDENWTDLIRKNLLPFLGSNMKFILDLTKELAQLQARDLLKPKMSQDVTPAQAEATSRLILWNKWSSIMSRINKQINNV